MTARASVADLCEQLRANARDRYNAAVDLPGAPEFAAAARLEALADALDAARMLHDIMCEALDVTSKGLRAVEGLITDSRGVAGLHLNGDEAPWQSLRTGGRFECWLLDFDAALARIAALAEGR